MSFPDVEYDRILWDTEGCLLQGPGSSLVWASSLSWNFDFSVPSLKPWPTAAQQWLKQMAACDKPLLIGNKNTRSSTALCTNTWSHCRFLCISRFYFESGLIFSMQNPHRMSNHARWVLEALLQFVKVKGFCFVLFFVLFCFALFHAVLEKPHLAQPSYSTLRSDMCTQHNL